MNVIVIKTMYICCFKHTLPFRIIIIFEIIFVIYINQLSFIDDNHDDDDEEEVY